MSINLPADSALAQHEQLSFADLKNNTFLSPQEIGFSSL